MGDLHLNQLLRTADDFVFADFEGPIAVLGSAALEAMRSERYSFDDPLDQLPCECRTRRYAHPPMGTFGHREIYRSVPRGGGNRVSQTQIARSCNIGQSCVFRYLKRFEESGLVWPLPAECDDRLLEVLLFSRAGEQAGDRPPIEFAALDRQLQAHKHVTLQLLWEEYRTTQPNGYRYSYFCQMYRRFILSRKRHVRISALGGSRSLCRRSAACAISTKKRLSKWPRIRSI
jgi:hypothetical protein